MTCNYNSGQRSFNIGYSKTSFADESDLHKSMAGQLFMMANGPVTWMVKTLKRVSTSTGEMEYVVLYEAGRKARWLIQWLQEVEIYNNLPFKIKCNNSGNNTHEEHWWPQLHQTYRYQTSLDL